MTGLAERLRQAERNGTRAVVIAEVARTIEADARTVFGTIADGGNYGTAIPSISRVEFVSAKRTGLGARFKETRSLTGLTALLANMFGVEATENECTEFVENARIRYTADASGAYWHSVFTVTLMDEGRRSRLEMRVETQPHSLLGRLVPPLLRRFVTTGITADVDAVKAYHERDIARGASAGNPSVEAGPEAKRQ
jgi:hypothetical protein